MRLMKNKFVLLILVAGMLVLPACNKSTQTQNNDGQNQDNASSDASNPPGGGFGNDADVYGEVKTISGDQVTVALLKMPERTQNRANSTMAPNSTRPPRGNGSMGQREYTGETVTLTISSDTSITTFDMGNRGNRGNGNNGGNAGGDNGNNGGSGGPGDNGNGGPGGNGDNGANGNNGSNGGNGGPGNGGGPGNFQEKQIKLSDVKVGSIIQVWYKADSGDKKEIEKVRVMQLPGNTNGQEQNGQQNASDANQS